jgi:hypothetical protein
VQSVSVRTPNPCAIDATRLVGTAHRPCSHLSRHRLFGESYRISRPHLAAGGSAVLRWFTAR